MLSIIRKSICRLSMLTRSDATEVNGQRGRIMSVACSIAVCAVVALLSVGFIGCQDGSVSPADGFINEQSEEAPSGCETDFCKIGDTIVCENADFGDTGVIDGTGLHQTHKGSDNTRKCGDDLHQRYYRYEQPFRI